MLLTHTFIADTYYDFEHKFQEALNNINFTPTLAIAFVSVNMPFTDIMHRFCKEGISLFGTSSCGEIMFTEAKDIVLEGGGVFMLTDMNNDFYKIELLEREDLSSKVFGNHAGDYIRNAFPECSLLVGTSGLSLDGQAFVEGVLEIAGNQLVMFGGMAGDDTKFEKTYVFTESRISTDGVVLLVFDKKHIMIKGLATSGWVGLGAELKVTRSEGNVVYEINNEPALVVYKNYLNVDEDDLPAIGLEYPLMIKRKNDEDANAWPLRAVLSVDKKEKTLIFAGSVPQGSTITFSSSPGFEIMETTREKIIEFYEKNPSADILILFSCVARQLALGPLITSEIKLAAIKWNKPIIGFFTYGEIGNNMNNRCDFYNQTFTLATISVA